ncbi:Glycosyltransferase-like 1B [Cladochytrium tenue]|nr:Glycosyltransferase-like 1B [Cladochytrium tenue]
MPAPPQHLRQHEHEQPHQQPRRTPSSRGRIAGSPSAKPPKDLLAELGRGARAHEAHDPLAHFFGCIADSRVGLRAALAADAALAEGNRGLDAIAWSDATAGVAAGSGGAAGWVQRMAERRVAYHLAAWQRTARVVLAVRAVREAARATVTAVASGAVFRAAIVCCDVFPETAEAAAEHVVRALVEGGVVATGELVVLGRRSAVESDGVGSISRGGIVESEGDAGARAAERRRRGGVPDLAGTARAAGVTVLESWEDNPSALADVDVLIAISAGQHAGLVAESLRGVDLSRTVVVAAIPGLGAARVSQLLRAPLVVQVADVLLTSPQVEVPGPASVGVAQDEAAGLQESMAIDRDHIIWIPRVQSGREKLRALRACLDELEAAVSTYCRLRGIEDTDKLDISRGITLRRLHAMRAEAQNSDGGALEMQARRLQRWWRSLGRTVAAWGAGAEGNAGGEGKAHDRSRRRTEFFRTPSVQPKVYVHDVTLVTLASAERISGLARVLEVWSGPVHIAYYAAHGEADAEAAARAWDETPGARDRVVVHVVWATEEASLYFSLLRSFDEAFPINTLRNVGEVGVRTSHVLHCDIDFVPSRGIREKLLIAHADLLDSTASREPAILVVPSFEMVPPGSLFPTLANHTGAVAGLTLPPMSMAAAAVPEPDPPSPQIQPAGAARANRGAGDRGGLPDTGDARGDNNVALWRRDGLEASGLRGGLGPGYRSRGRRWPGRRVARQGPQEATRLPQTKKQAREMLFNYELRAFHLARWVDADRPYSLVVAPEEISETYEPFAILPTGTASWNENFAGYGRDKTLYFYELRVLRRLPTIVLDDVFLVHRDHDPSPDAIKFRTKYSLQYRLSRLLVYDREQDLLDEQYARAGRLPAGHEARVAVRRAERAVRYAALGLEGGGGGGDGMGVLGAGAARGRGEVGAVGGSVATASLPRVQMLAAIALAAVLLLLVVSRKFRRGRAAHRPMVPAALEAGRKVAD